MKSFENLCHIITGILMLTCMVIGIKQLIEGKYDTFNLFLIALSIHVVGESVKSFNDSKARDAMKGGVDG